MSTDRKHASVPAANLRKGRSRAELALKVACTPGDQAINPELPTKRSKAVASETLSREELAAASARLAALPAGFADWVHTVPKWPDAVPEVIGPHEKAK
jgi:hypothetical protein